MTVNDKCLPQKLFDGLIQLQQGFLDIFFQGVTVSNFAHSPIGSGEIKPEIMITSNLHNNRTNNNK